MRAPREGHVQLHDAIHRRAARQCHDQVPLGPLVQRTARIPYLEERRTPGREKALRSRAGFRCDGAGRLPHDHETVLASAGKYIIRTSAISGPGQVTTTYLDPVTGTTRSVVTGAGDKVTYWIQTQVSGDRDHWRTTYVDYTRHTWWTKTSHSGLLGNDTSGVPVLSAQTSPSLISKALALGELRIGRKGQVSGHAAIELVYAGKLAAKADAVHYWVNARTYQPVRIDMPPFTAASTVAESWIPKSAANVTRTDKPRIPHGFRQVPPSTTFN